jgi:ferredoxin-NADP reductase
MDPAHRRVLLLAGGIGITPIYAMAQALRAAWAWSGN